MQVSYSVIYKFQKLLSRVDALSTEQFKDFINANWTTQKALVGNASTNWQDQIYRTAVGTDHGRCDVWLSA
jgi:iron complex outermembrane receptor protein